MSAQVSGGRLGGSGVRTLNRSLIVIGSQNKKIIVRAIGPSLTLAGKVADPTLELHDANGGTLETNDNWVDSPNKQANDPATE
jgi:hypothetical protein